MNELNHDRGVAMLITTHYMDEVERLCDRIGIVRRGQLVAVGTAADLRRALGRNDATLDDVFNWYAGGEWERGGAFLETARARQVARRVG
jgi:ABC-2 type transport system ATP-binding protein